MSVLVASDNNVYAGGEFTIAGGNAAASIAKWNGSNWSALGSGVNKSVLALVASGSDLYAGGNFTSAGGIQANRIAKWDGSSWTALGSGIGGNFFSGGVKALAVSGADLYAGGDFFSAGSKVSAYAAKANISGLPFPGRFSSLAYSPITGFSCTFLDASVGQSYRIQTSPTLAAGSWTDFTNFTYTAPIVITDASAGSGTNKFLRAVTP